MSLRRCGQWLLPVVLVATCYSCTPSVNDFPGTPPGGMMGDMAADDGDMPEFDTAITVWDGEVADDAHLDVVGADKDFYHEANTFTSVVTITYNDASATATTTDDRILLHTSGAYVTVDMLTHSVSGVEIIMSGTSEDGGLKVYGSNKYKLTLSGVELTSQTGPAINSQCKKRVYVHLQEGTTNRLTDAASYSTDTYYIDATADEDRKGCFFSEGNLVLSGTGILVVAGRYKHAIATDGYFWMRPGVTVAITEAAKNAIHVKGDSGDNIGVYIQGGLIYANMSSEAGKGIKCDMNVEVAGGRLLLNTSGDALYEADENDTSSAAAIKTDGAIIISGGAHTLKSIGSGGKGLNADTDIIISGGETAVITTGSKYTYSSALTSSPKGVKSDGDIDISGGRLNISVTGKSDGSEGMESKSAIRVSGGEVYAYAYDDAINAATAFEVSGGRVYAYASNNDGIDSNGTMLITGGLVIASGANAPEGGLDVDNSNLFKVNGGIVVAVGGSLQSNPSSSSTGRSVVYNGMAMSKGENIVIGDSSSTPLLAFELPRTMNNASLFFSSPALEAGGSYTIFSGVTLSEYTDSWHGWYDGAVWDGGNQLITFTSDNIVTTIGNANGGPGGGGLGGPGGHRPW